MSEYLQKIKDQKKAADYILSKIRQFYPSAIVAGGAPRDWIFRKPAKDIDIYFHTDDEASTVNEKFEKCGFLDYDGVFDKDGSEYDLGPDSEDKEKSTDRYFVRIFNMEFDGEDIQFIQTNCPESDVLKKFSSNISMVSYANNRYHMEDDFIFGYCTGCLAFYRSSTLFNQSYIDKIIGYYPNYKIVDPENLVDMFIKTQVSSKIAKIRHRLLDD